MTPVARSGWKLALIALMAGNLLTAAGEVSTVGASAVSSAPGSTGWPTPDHDLLNSRTAAGSPIDGGDVKSLAPLWQVPIKAGLPTSPVIVGRAVFVEDQSGAVYRINLDSGKTEWQSPSYGSSIGPLGVAVGWGKVFATTGNSIFALNEETGHLLWSTSLTVGTTNGVDVEPQVVGNKVIVSTVPVAIGAIYKGGNRGFVEAVAQRTGKILWRFDTVASATLWANPGVNSGGGSWYPPAYSAATGLLYVGIANPAPFVGTPQYPNGSSRPGPNLYTDATVALRLSSGRLVWYHQATPHDIRDYDLVHAMVVPIPARAHRPPRTVVVGTGKSGIVIAMAPKTGALLWKTEVGLHLNDTLPALSGPTEVLPGTFGGVLTPPASADGRVFVAALNAPDILQPDQTAYFGGKTGTMPGDVVAIDARTGRHLWDTKVPGDPTGGVTVVNNLVLTATLQGGVYGLSMATGRIVWSIKAPGGINGWMSIAGDKVVIPVGVGANPLLWALSLPTRGGSRASG